MRSTRFDRLCLGILLLFALSSSALAQPFFTSFEGITDTDGEFMVTDGDPAITATFSGGESMSVGNFALYHTGLFSWMVDVGHTGSVTFGRHVSAVNFWVRDEFADTDGVVTVFDDNGQLLFTVNADDVEWTEVDVVAPDPNVGIALIRLEHTGASGYTNLDDLTADALEGSMALEDPIPEPIPTRGPGVRLVPVAEGLVAPNWGISAPDGLLPGLLFVSDQPGILWKIRRLTGSKSVFLDVSDRLVTLGIGGEGSFDERGLLGFAFHPDYVENGLLYTYTSEPADQLADFTIVADTIDHHSVITEWHVANPADANSLVDPGSARVLMRIEQPQFNHDGGALNFGPDGKLYISLGDGGNADDEGDGHSTGGNGQDRSNVLGSLLRIDPLGSNSANGKYGVPIGNPFVGEPGVVPEIFAYGFRNLFRFSFDRETGRLWGADVGQNDIEEVDRIVRGGNYGWNFKEGSFFFDGNGEDPGFVTDVDPGVPPGLIDPVGEYDHDEGIAIIGGFVYRGTLIPRLVGRYVFGDLSQAFFGNDGRLFTLAGRNVRELLLQGGQPNLGMSLLGFGQDSNGELYVLGNLTGTPFGDTGVVMRIGRARATAP